MSQCHIKRLAFCLEAQRYRMKIESFLFIYIVYICMYIFISVYNTG